MFLPFFIVRYAWEVIMVFVLLSENSLNLNLVKEWSAFLWSAFLYEKMIFCSLSFWG